MTKNITPEYEKMKKHAGSLLAAQREKSNRINTDGEWIRITQKDIAERADLTDKRVFQWEDGDLPGSRHKLLEIIKAYQFEDKDRADEFLQALHLPPRWYMPVLEDGEWENCRGPNSVEKGGSARFGPMQFQAGMIKFPVIRIVGGDGETRYRDPDGISAVFHNTHLILPQRIHDHYSYLLGLRRRESDGRVFEQRNMIRLDDFEIKLSDPTDAPHHLKLHVSLTNFFDMNVTNKSLNTRLPDNSTLRDEFAGDPLELRGSRLANPLAINLSLVTTKDWKIHVARRGSKVATNSNGWGPAVSGTANQMADLKEFNKYDPFNTAVRESFEELTSPYRPDKSAVTIFGLARTLVYYFPFLFGELRLDLSEDDLRSHTPPDVWEGRGLLGIPFKVTEVIAFIKELHKEMISNDNTAIGTTIFSLYMSLIYQYPEQRMEIIKMLS